MLRENKKVFFMSNLIISGKNSLNSNLNVKKTKELIVSQASVPAVRRGGELQLKQCHWLVKS